jgi:hypothetical protein
LRPPRAQAFALVVVGLVALSACGTGSDAEKSGDIPITQRAIAAIALEYLPAGTTTREATYTDNHDPKGALGADLRYAGDGEDDGGLLRVFITPKVEKKPCADQASDGCTVRNVDGGKLVLSWATEEPEEDPGFVDVTMIREGQETQVSWSGDTIKGDPRAQHLRISITRLEAVAQDKRLGLTTSQEAIDAGKGLKEWKGGEPDPTAYDRVPSTDDSLINSYWSAHGGYGAFHDRGSSPLKSEFGPGAIGGRFTAEKEPDMPAQTIDVLAAPQAPSWMAKDPCATKRLAGHCATYTGKLGPRYFAWIPGPEAKGGAIWMFAQRKHEFVAIRKSGFDVPTKVSDAKLQADWYFVDSFLNKSTFGLQTDREMLDTDFG